MPQHIAFQTQSVSVYFFQMTSVKACGVRMIHAMAYAFRTASARAYAFQTRSVKAYFLQTTSVRAFSFWIRCSNAYLSTHATANTSGLHLPVHMPLLTRAGRAYVYYTKMGTAVAFRATIVKAAPFLCVDESQA